jgi:23S rRNA pseudouridine955/2504/2580 synthase
MKQQTPSSSSVTQVTIDENYNGQRLDNYLIRILKGVPKSRIYRIIRKGEVRINKKRAKPEQRLETGDMVRIPPIQLATPQIPSLPKKGLTTDIEKHIQYEDENLLILNKPSGIAVHGGSGVNFGVIELLRMSRRDAKFLELVHRLDRDTSGCLLVAKKPSVLKQLHELLREGGVDKRYLALVKGHWPKKQVEVSAPLLKYQTRAGERIVTINAEEGKTSLTEFHVLQYFENCTLVEAIPHTGRTHQIRVHAAYMQHPIAGDEKYGDKEFNKIMRAVGLKRLFLHAASLSFYLEEKDKAISVKAGLDDDMKTILKRME